MQRFASFEPFEIFDNFNGVEGTYIKSFLISDKINLNDWQATHEANIANLESFIGRPGIHYINPVNGKRDHTGATTFEKSLQLQELYRVASVISVGSDIPTKKNWQVSKMTDQDITDKIKSKEIKFISPSIWPDEDSVEIIEKIDGTTVDVVHGYRGLHYAFVDEPAFGVEAEIKSFCDGTSKACAIELQKFDASINEVGPITDKKIIVPKKDGAEEEEEEEETEKKSKKFKKKMQAAPKWQANTSHNVKLASKTQMATTEELQKKLDESEKALKATEEELEKLKDKEAKKATELEEEEKESKARKAEEEDKEDEEKTALKAAVERLEKVPIVDKIVSSQLSAGMITEDKVSEITSGLMAATKDELTRTLSTSKSYEAKLKSLSASVSVPYMGSDNGSFDASLSDIDDEQLLMEVSG